MAQTKQQAVEKASLLAIAPILISAGIELVEKQPLPGIILIVLGIACIAFREYRKTK